MTVEQFAQALTSECGSERAALRVLVESHMHYEREVERATSRDRGIKAIRPGNVNWDPVMTPSYIGRVN